MLNNFTIYISKHAQKINTENKIKSNEKHEIYIPNPHEQMVTVSLIPGPTQRATPYQHKFNSQNNKIKSISLAIRKEKFSLFIRHQYSSYKIIMKPKICYDFLFCFCYHTTLRYIFYNNQNENRHTYTTTKTKGFRQT